MKIVVKLVNGDVLASTPRTRAEIQADLDKDTSGQFARRGTWTKPTVDDIVADLIDSLKHFKDLNYLSLDVDGQDYYINPVNILWAKLVDVDE